MLTTAARVAVYRRQNPGRRTLTPRQLARIVRKEIRESWPTGEWSDVSDYRCCALDDGHDGPCAWRCTGCASTGNCVMCGGTGGADDVQQCHYCNGTGACNSGCHDGWRIDE
jgi:hypothetical protein